MPPVFRDAGISVTLGRLRSSILADAVMRARNPVDLLSRASLTTALSVLAVASTLSAACTRDRPSRDADAAADGAVTFDGDNRFDAVDFDASDGATTTDVAPPRWTCPAEWVAYARGGCGPAVLLCATTGGGAAPGACDTVDVTRPRAIVAADGGVPGVSFFVQSDGGIGGGWNAPRNDGDGGVNCPTGWSRGVDDTCAPALRTDCPRETSALPDGTCTATGSDGCPAETFADPGPEAMGAIVVHVLAGADDSTADGSEANPFATIADGILHAGADGFVLVGAGTYAEPLAIGAAVHLVGACASRTHIAAGTGDAPSLHVSGPVDVEVRGVSIGGAGGGILAEGGARLALASVRIDEATGFALLATGAGTAVDATDLLVSNTRFVVGGAPGVGVRVRDGARFSGSRLAYVSNHGGIAVRDTGSLAVLSNAVVRDSLPRYDGTEAAGLAAYAGGQLEASFAVVMASRGYGVVSDQAGSVVRVQDSTISESVPLSDSAPGIGAQAREGASITLVRTTIEHNRGAGVSAVGLGTQLALTDTAVSDTLPTLGGTRGYAFDVQGGSIVAERTLLAAATDAAVFAVGGHVEMRDAIVIGTRPSIRGLGFGIAAGSGTEMTGARVAIENVSGAAVAATNAAATLPAEGASVSLSDLFVRDVHDSTVQIAPNDAPTGPSVGYGLASASASTLRATYLVIADGSIGLYNRGATLTLDTGLVTGQHAGSALASASPTSMPMLYNIVFLGNERDGPVIDPTLPDPLSQP
jgi:hypothetical protein